MANNQQKANQLRSKHSTFSYQSYFWELVPSQVKDQTSQGVQINQLKQDQPEKLNNKTDLKITFNYSISPDINFTPSLVVHNVSEETINSLGKETIDSYVFNIGLSEMYSYWKTTASPKIEVEAGKLSQEQISFWHKLLLKGMGEFFYTNQIEFADPNFVAITSTSEKEHLRAQKNLMTATKKILIPVGGGKDSAVTLELLKQNYQVGTYTVSAPQSAADTIKNAQIPLSNQIKITRTLDPKLFELNQQGYLNGHVPISAFLAFTSIFAAKLFDYTHIAISNERSSNEGNTWYCDQEINHQYSKTFEFEQDLANYSKQYLPARSPLYFSFLRPLYELQIGQLFAKMPQYHQNFRSCNRGQKENVWCGECSKCLFAWVIIFPFLNEEKMTKYFGKNLFADEKLWPITKELLGITTTKPFECVGTHEETIIAFYLSIQAYLEVNKSLPALLEKVSLELADNEQLKVGPTGENSYAKRAENILFAWNSQHLLSQDLEQVLKNSLEDSRN